MKTADHDRWIEGWKETQAIERDTIAYLQTLQRLKQNEGKDERE